MPQESKTKKDPKAKDKTSRDEGFKVRRIGEEEKLPFTHHLIELRYRLVASIVAIVVGFLICWHFREFFIALFEAPIKKAVPDLQMTFLAPAEGFFVPMKVAFFAGFALAFPVIIYQVWMFVSPGLHKKERGYVFPFVLIGSLLFLTGASFNYYIILPFGLNFLITFGQEYWQANITADYYLSFCLKLTVAFGLVFQLPLILAVLGKMDIVSSRQLKNGRRYSIVIAFVIAAILTPPDVFTQCLMAGPLIFLYEVSIHVVRIIEKKRVTPDVDDNQGETQAP